MTFSNDPLQFFFFVVVVKRSADLHVQAKFAQFSGNKITEYDIFNLEDVLEYEKNNQ